MIELRNVCKQYNAFTPVKVLQGIDLVVERGQTLAIVGPSGSGKSTLLNLIGGLDQADAGEVLFDGRDTGLMKPDELADFRARQVGFVFQSHHLLPQCSALENVMVPTLARGVGQDRGVAVQRAKQLLERVGLSERMHHRPGQLSGGECQRVAVVRALINGPKVLLADEPTGSLDAEASGELVQLLVDLNRDKQVTLVVVTHSMQVAEQMDKVLQLTNGRLAEAGVES